MGKTTLALGLVVALALSAGLVAGMALRRIPAASVELRQPRTPLAEELQLSDLQIKEMRGIWEGVREKVDSAFQDAQGLHKNRDDALFAMLNDKQKAEFAAIQKDYADRLAGLKTQRDALFATAVKQTEQILSDPQKKRYREILASRLGQDQADTMEWVPKRATASTAAAGQ